MACSIAAFQPQSRSTSLMLRMAALSVSVKAWSF